MKISHFFWRSWRMQLPVTLVWSFKYTWGDLKETYLIYALWVVPVAPIRGYMLCGLCPWEDLCFVGYAGCTPERIYCALWVVHMRGFIMLCGLCPWEDLLCVVGCAHGRIHALWVVPMRGCTMLCGLRPWGYIILCGLRFSEALVSWTLSGHKRQVSWHNNTTKWTSTQKSLKTLPPKMNALSWPGNFSFLRKELTNLITSNNLGLHCWLIQRVDYNTRSKNKEFCFFFQKFTLGVWNSLEMFKEL